MQEEGEGAERDNWKGLPDLFVYLGRIAGFELRNNSELRDNRVCKACMFGLSWAAPDLPYVKNVLLFRYFDIWGFTDPRETALPRASQFLETAKDIYLG